MGCDLVAYTEGHRGPGSFLTIATDCRDVVYPICLMCLMLFKKFYIRHIRQLIPVVAYNSGISCMNIYIPSVRHASKHHCSKAV